MIDSDTEDICCCKTREEAIKNLGEKGARIWDWLREQERQAKARAPIGVRYIKGKISFDRGLLGAEPIELVVQMAIDMAIVDRMDMNATKFSLLNAVNVADSLMFEIRRRIDEEDEEDEDDD